MKNPSKKSVYQQQRASATISKSCQAAAAAMRNRVYSKTGSRRPAAMRNPRQRVKYC